MKTSEFKTVFSSKSAFELMHDTSIAQLTITNSSKN